MMGQPVLARSAATLQGFRISPGDSNYFTMVVEIFEPGGRTPPNTHQAAFESLFVLLPGYAGRVGMHGFSDVRPGHRNSPPEHQRSGW